MWNRALIERRIGRLSYESTDRDQSRPPIHSLESLPLQTMSCHAYITSLKCIIVNSAGPLPDKYMLDHAERRSGPAMI